MSVRRVLEKQLHIHRIFAVQFLSVLVAAHGSFILATTLLDQLSVHHGSRLSDITVDVPLLIGLGLIYLATLLRRRKRSAWSITLLAYMFYFGLTFSQLLMKISVGNYGDIDVIRSLILPLAIIGFLWLFRKEFVVKSDQQGFRWALRFVTGILAITFIYGVVGFVLLDRSDFHEEISLPTAVHYTIDQFDLTTDHPLHPVTRRAHLFVDSLSFVSIAAIGYGVVSLFQPLRLRFSDQTRGRTKLSQLLHKYHAPSEDFFKLWPHDKHYFFDQNERSGLAYHVHHGIALCVADPAGDPRSFGRLLNEFDQQCFSNDWTPAFVHVESKYAKLYEKHGFTMQKLGEEAVVNLAHFQADIAPGKYFRQINNKFSKRGFTAELLQPPHHDAVLKRLRTISDQWQDSGRRAERGFMMGYHSDEYLQQCSIMVVRDAASTIQAFANLVPASFDTEEATFDILRHTSDSLSNINDFLLTNLITILVEQNYTRLNLGLCPLVGLDDADTDTKNNALIDGFLRFTYANGDRFYSFSGLKRFKAKYDPEWQDRYIAYHGGVPGFSRTINALMRAIRVKS